MFRFTKVVVGVAGAVAKLASTWIHAKRCPGRHAVDVGAGVSFIARCHRWEGHHDDHEGYVRLADGDRYRASWSTK